MDEALQVYRGQAHDVEQAVMERYASHQTVADIDSVCDSSEFLLASILLGDVRRVMPSAGAMPLLALNSTWAPLHGWCRSLSDAPLAVTPFVLPPKYLAKNRVTRDKVALQCRTVYSLPRSIDTLVTQLLPFCEHSAMTETEAFGSGHSFS